MRGSDDRPRAVSARQMPIKYRIALCGVPVDDARGCCEIMRGYPARTAADPLTALESRVVGLLARGWSAAAIALECQYSRNGARMILLRLRRRFCVKTNVELVVALCRRGFEPVGGEPEQPRPLRPLVPPSRKGIVPRAPLTNLAKRVKHAVEASGETFDRVAYERANTHGSSHKWFAMYDRNEYCRDDFETSGIHVLWGPGNEWKVYRFNELLMFVTGRGAALLEGEKF
jgi:DNA-binding CsgD family transcriptional regulator